jgi:mRNA-degrading endonuclease RelE of RelBE toxin-antitoxin system
VEDQVSFDRAAQKALRKLQAFDWDQLQQRWEDRPKQGSQLQRLQKKVERLQHCYQRRKEGLGGWRRRLWQDLVDDLLAERMGQTGLIKRLNWKEARTHQIRQILATALAVG